MLKVIAVNFVLTAFALAGASAQTTQPDHEQAPTVTSAAPEGQAPSQAGQQDLTPASQPDEGTPRVPTPEEMMQALFGDSPSQSSPSKVFNELASSVSTSPVVARKPIDGGDNQAVEPSKPTVKSRLRPEGDIIVNRRGHLAQDRGRWLFIFEADNNATEPPMVLLPNNMLEAMLHQANYGRGTVYFRVDGEVTQYHETNYLLLRKVLIEQNMDRF